MELACEISNDDPLKFIEVFESVPIGNAFLIYEHKIKRRNDETDARMRIELMKMDILGMMLTGKSPGLLEKYAPEKKKKINPISELSKLGIKVKPKQN